MYEWINEYMNELLQTLKKNRTRTQGAFQFVKKKTSPSYCTPELRTSNMLFPL